MGIPAGTPCTTAGRGPERPHSTGRLGTGADGLGVLPPVAPVLLRGCLGASAHSFRPPSCSRGAVSFPIHSPTRWCVCVRVRVRAQPAAHVHPGPWRPRGDEPQFPPWPSAPRQAAGKAPSPLHPFPSPRHKRPLHFCRPQALYTSLLYKVPKTPGLATREVARPPP